MNIQAVVFDIGNVLIKWAPEAFYDKAIGQDRRRAFFAEVPIFEMNERVDQGAELRASVTALGEQYPDWAAEIQLWHDNWLDMVGPALDRSVRLLRALRRRGVPVFALSNFGRETFALAEAHYPFLEEFDKRFISGHLELIKPDPAIYAALEEATGLRGDALIFVDDMPENIAAAEARGWLGHRFTGAEGWAERLVSEGLLSAEDAE